MPDARRLRWEERHLGAVPPGTPSTFVRAALACATPPEPAATATAPRALDVACGSGRHALLLARSGYRVVAVDYARAAGAALAARARGEALALDVVVADVTTWPLPPARFAVVVVVDFLERAIVPALRAAVAPGGLLVMETFLAGHERFGPPRDPDFLLQPGELHAFCGDWTVLAAYEGETSAPLRACRAGIAAMRPATR